MVRFKIQGHSSNICSCFVGGHFFKNVRLKGRKKYNLVDITRHTTSRTKNPFPLEDSLTFQTRACFIITAYVHYMHPVGKCQTLKVKLWPRLRTYMEQTDRQTDKHRDYDN